HLRQRLLHDLRRRPPHALDARDVEGAFLVLDDLRLVDGGKARALQEPLDRLLRRADARALALLVHVRGLWRAILDAEAEPARRREGRDRLEGEAAGLESLAQQARQIFFRALLHARRDFLGEEFD